MSDPPALVEQSRARHDRVAEAHAQVTAEAGIPKNLPALTSLRGVAALTVLVFHVTQDFRGYLAVDLFFLLSGFVLMHVYGRMVPTRESYFGFLKARLARIYPVHLLTLAMLLPMFESRPDFSFGGLAISLLLLQSPWYSACWNYGAWSISAEWHAYLLFPFLVKIYRERSTAGLVVTLVACAATAGLLAHFAGSGNITNTPMVLARCLPEFIAGMVLYSLFERGTVRWITGDTAISIVVVLLILSEIAGVPDGILIALLGALLLCAAANHGYAERLLCSRILQYLGYISYSLYMVQMASYVLVTSYFPEAGYGRDALFVGLSLGLAAMISPLFEYPARDWLKNRWRRPEPDMRGAMLQPGLPS
jgi:peptidoglycan/LPS O-acetylase OafA/YrhL